MQKLRLDFWSKIRDIPVEDLVFLDEARVNLALVRLYARALRGCRARGSRPQKRGKNVSMIGALALKGIVASINRPLAKVVTGVKWGLKKSDR